MHRYRLVSRDGAYEMFPNGHKRFLTRSALGKVNSGRQDAILRNETDWIPYVNDSPDPALDDKLRYSTVDELRERLLLGSTNQGREPARTRVQDDEEWDPLSTTIPDMPAGPDRPITLRARARKGRTIDVAQDDTIAAVFVRGNAQGGDAISLRVHNVFYGRMDYVKLLVDGSAGRASRSRSRMDAYLVCTIA